MVLPRRQVRAEADGRPLRVKRVERPDGASAKIEALLASGDRVAVRVACGQPDESDAGSVPRTLEIRAGGKVLVSAPLRNRYG